MIKSITIHSRSSYWTSNEQHDELEVDSDDLAKTIEDTCNQLEKEGFEVISISPINSGNLVAGSGAYYTKSVIVTARRKK